MRKTAAEGNETKRFWFYFEPADFKGVQDYLNEKAVQGWELVSVDGFFTAEFVRTLRTDLTYYVDVAPLWDAPDIHDSYLRLCEDAGWELVDKSRNGIWRRYGMWLFKSMPGRNPLPVQTDGKMEAKRYWKLVVLFPLLLLALDLPSILNQLFGLSLRESSACLWCEHWLLAFLPVFLLIGLAGLLEMVGNAIWYRWSLRKYGAMTAPPQAVLYGRSIVHLLGSLICCVLLIAALFLDGLRETASIEAYLFFGLTFVFLLLHAAVGLNHWTPTKRQRKVTLCAAALCLVLLIAFGLLDWKGPWKSYSRGIWTAFSYTPSDWREQVAGDPVVQMEDLGMASDSISGSYEHGLVPAGGMWKNSERGMLDSGELGRVESWYYRCFTERLAVQLTDSLWKGAGAYGEPVQLTERPLEGFDGSWYGTYEEFDTLFYVLMVRQGKTVALVKSTVDLWEPEYLSSVRAALGF